MRLDVAVEEVGPDQTNTTVDVVPDSPRRDDPTLIRVRRANAADTETVTPMDVRHRQAGMLDAGEERDVRHLVRRLVLLDRVKQAFACEDEAINAHALLVTLWNAPARGIYLFERAVESVLTHVKHSPIRCR